MFEEFRKNLLARFITDNVGVIQATNLGSNNIQNTEDLGCEIAKAKIRANELTELQSSVKDQKDLISEIICETLLDELLHRDPILFQAIWKKYESLLMVELKKT